MRSFSIITCFGCIALIFTSCNKYIDDIKRQEVQIEKGYFRFYLDSNELVYKSNVSLKRDGEKLTPKSFRALLPKKIRFYEFSASSEFAFYYDKHQVILIKTNYDKSKNIDTVYNPSKTQLENFIRQLVISGSGKYNIKKIGFKKGRINKIIMNENSTILFYNLIEGNEAYFSQLLKKLVLLEK